MPIEFAPPSPNVQPFNVTPPQYTDPLQTLAQMGQLRTQGLQQQTAQLGLENERMKLDSNKGLMKAMVDAGTQGTPGEIFQRTLQNATRPGSGVMPGDVIGLHQHYNQLLQEAATRKKTELENQGADIDRLQGIYEPLTRPGATDEDFAKANATADQLGIDKRIPRLTQWTDPEHVAAFSNGLSLHSKILADAKEKAATEASQASAGEAGAKAEEAKATTAETQLKTKQLQSQLDWLDNLTPKTLGDYVGASIDKTKYPDLYARAYNDASNARAMRKPELMQAAIDKYATIASEQEKTISTETNPAVRQARTDQAVATARAVAPIKIDVAGQVAAATAGARADAAGLTEDDYNRAGEQYIRTGVMPAVGRDSLTRGRIVKAGNQFARDNGLSPSDVITMQAAYAGDKDSLKKFQAQRDQIVSFEQTAQKNLDLFLGLASKIPDTGVPWLNTPLRDLNEKMIGSENMAAVNAARQVANNEVAKVTSGGGLSGVLSDSARHEVESYNPKNATFAQTKAVANVVKQDMANRHGSMDATLSDIKARIGGGTKTGQEAKPTHRFNPTTGKIEEIK